MEGRDNLTSPCLPPLALAWQDWHRELLEAPAPLAASPGRGHL